MLGLMDTEGVFGTDESAPHFVQIARILAAEILKSHELEDAAQRLSGPVDARELRETDGAVLEYSEGVSEQLTLQTRPAGAEFVAPQQSTHPRQKGAE